MRERNPANPGQRFDWMGFQCDANLNVHLTSAHHKLRSPRVWSPGQFTGLGFSHNFDSLPDGKRKN
jgi:hypothetical protein